MLNKIRPYFLLAIIITALAGCFFMHEAKSKENEAQILTKEASQIKDPIFDQAFSIVLGHEGGFSNDKNDAGGATAFGISLRFMKDDDIDIDGDGDIDLSDVKALTKAESKEIYYHFFWIKNNYQFIENSQVAVKLFDMAVNMGAYQANKICKRAINDILVDNMPVNGIMNEETIATLNEIHPSAIIQQLRERQAEFYRSIVAKNPKLKKFENGWLARAEF